MAPTYTTTLAAVRRDAGLTQHDVARHLGVAQATVSTDETGRAPIPAYRAAKYAELYGIDIGEGTPADIGRVARILGLRVDLVGVIVDGAA